MKSILKIEIKILLFIKYYYQHSIKSANISKYQQISAISRQQLKMDYYTEYSSDSGNRDLSSEKRYNKDRPFNEILREAIELKAHLIVKTSYINNDKPGAWYIKGYKNNYTYEEINQKLRIMLKIKNILNELVI